MEDPLASNVEQVRARVRRAAERAGRDPEEIRMVAVTKTVPVERIRRALELGLRLFGENRIQEALPKIAALQGEPGEWHLIGHLQTNKVRFVPDHFRVVHSLDRVRLIEALQARLRDPLDVLIEVNLAEEPQKTGARPAEVDALIQALAGAASLRLRGLMTIAPLADDPERSRPVFKGLRALRDQLRERFAIALPELSMGMTDDYPVAVEEGATMLRLGRALFGRR